MKKLMILAASAVMALGITNVTFASEPISLKDQAGITPDSILYPADKVIDAIQITLSFSDSAKASTLSDIAEEKLGESEIMVDKNNQSLANTAIDDYKNYMDRAESKIEDTLNNNKNTYNQDKLKNLEYVEDKIIIKEKKSLYILTKLQNKVSGNAKTVLAKIIEIQTAKRNAILAVKKERVLYINAKKQYNEAKIALEKAKKSGDETAIKAAEDLLGQKQQALDTEKQNFVKAVQTKKEVSKISVGKLIKESKIQKRKNLKLNVIKKPNKTNTPVTKTAVTKNTITNETLGTAVTNPSASKPAVVNNKNVKKRSVKVVKNRIKKESCNNKIREKNQSKITSNSNRQKSVKLQH